MQDPPRRGGQPQHRDPRGDGDEREHPPSSLLPPPGGWAPPDSGSDHDLPRSKSVEFDLPSPARPKSPWGRFDPYDNNEVTRGAEGRRPGVGVGGGGVAIRIGGDPRSPR